MFERDQTVSTPWPSSTPTLPTENGAGVNWFHRLANIRAKLPDDAASEVMAHVYAVRDRPTLDAGTRRRDRLIAGYDRDFPAAVACLRDDLQALLAIHRVPVRHRIRVRTTNLAERSFVRSAAARSSAGSATNARR